MNLHDLPGRWRLPLARAVAWALLLGGWVGLGGVAQALVGRPAVGIVLMAGWLLALGVCSQGLSRSVLPRATLRALLLAAALVGAGALCAALPGGGAAAGPGLRVAPAVPLMVALLAWALLLVLTSTVVRRCRRANTGPPALPTASAALGALLAWGWVGDISDISSLGPRLVGGVVAAGALLAGCVPVGAASPGTCRAGLFDCSWSAGGRAVWKDAGRWPLGLASMVMLPMMCTLPLMLGLCRSEGVSARAALGLHLAGMFAPALLGAGRPVSAGAAPGACAALLAAGGAALWALPGPAGGWVLLAAHGAAWSVAWTTHLQDRTPASPAGSVLRAAAGNALFALALGLGVDRFGLAALSAWQMALGMGGLALAARVVWRRWETAKPLRTA